MPKPDSKTFYRDVYNIVSQIPCGRVLTYGDIARLAGWPQHSRLVGRALREVPAIADGVAGCSALPCHRVVNAAGRTAPGWTEQPSLLCAEGIAFKRNGSVDLAHSLWEVAREEGTQDS